MPNEFPIMILDLARTLDFTVWDEFTHSLALLPKGVTLEAIRNKWHFIGLFWVEPDCGFDVLNSAAFGIYLNRRHPIVVHARRPKDLRPFFRRADRFKGRGYEVTVLNGAGDGR
jgi:hypothetical protein